MKAGFALGLAAIFAVWEIFTDVPAMAAKAGGGEECAKAGGICGCSFGRILCCDGSYLPRHYRTGEGRIVTNYCTTPANANALGNELGQTLPAYHPSSTRPQPLSPSQEIYWKGSIFDR
jgi:hypothetical protein